VIADLLVDSDIAETASDVQPDLAKHHPLQIAVCVRKLASGQDFVTVEFGGRQIVTQVLDVDSRKAHFIFDAGSVAAGNRALQASNQLVFHSLPGGVRTEFTTEPAEPIVFEGRLPYEAPFPAVLYWVQRREYFRVQTQLLAPYTASGRYGDGDSFTVELHDLSLGGVALRTAHARFGALEAGCVLQGITVRLGDYGTLELDLEIVSARHSLSAGG
jgi:c-di-GMP-binding flagellar brake protein YcgR